MRGLFFKKNSFILLTPGPVPISNKVKKQLSRSMTHHRLPEISQALNQIQYYLKEMFQTKEHVFLLHSTGTGAMEAAITNTLSPQDEALSVCAGKFGWRWHQIATSHHILSRKIEIPYGEAITPSAIKEHLEQYPQTKAVLIQACETSTGTLHPIQEISQITQGKNVLLIVDSISALISVDLKMDEWGIDVLIGGSQKSFGLPAGMSFLALSKKAQEFQNHSKCPCSYFDLAKEKKSNRKGQTAYSTNVSFVRALKTQLESYHQQGLPALQQKTQQFSQATKIFCQHLNLSLFSKSPSPSVTAIAIPENIDGNQVKKFMMDHQIIAGGGQDHLEGKIIRFGHLVHIPIRDYLKGLLIFGKALIHQNPHIFTQSQLKKALYEARNILIKKIHHG